jgi:hypothetical protein
MGRVLTEALPNGAAPAVQAKVVRSPLERDDFRQNRLLAIVLLARSSHDLPDRGPLARAEPKAPGRSGKPEVIAL